MLYASTTHGFGIMVILGMDCSQKAMWIRGKDRFDK